MFSNFIWMRLKCERINCLLLIYPNVTNDAIQIHIWKSNRCNIFLKLNHIGLKLVQQVHVKVIG